MQPVLLKHQGQLGLSCGSGGLSRVTGAQRARKNDYWWGEPALPYATRELPLAASMAEKGCPPGGGFF